MPDKPSSTSTTTTSPQPPPTDKSSTPRTALPPSLQEIVDKNEESLFDQIYDGTAAESTDTSLRYAAYATRLRTLLLSAHRYVAYTSDIGESFRPVAHPGLIRTAYGISWAYLIGDVSHEGYKAYLRNQRVLHPGERALSSRSAGERIDDGAKSEREREREREVVVRGKVPLIEDYRAVMAQRAMFQSVASMGLPAFTIHSIVRYSGRALRGVKNVRLRTYGPIGLGLAAVPFLPFLFDKPVEEATEWVFHKAFETFGGEGAVGYSPEPGRGKGKEKEKEL